MAFGKQAFDFLERLDANNNREWFKAHQAEFEEVVREPALAFIEDMAIWFEANRMDFEAVPKKVGGSLGRIQRDVRFSKDKTPYHTYVLYHFYPSDKKERTRAGFGIRVGPHDLGIGGGIWQADTSTLNRIRDGIIRDPEGWKAVSSHVVLSDERLKNPPRGYDKEHPLIEDLKLKQFVGRQPFTKTDARDLLKAVQSKGQPVIDFVKWVDANL